MIGPGKAFDTDRYFVVSTNLLGGCRGTTGPSSIDPATGRPYGPDFPVITVADMVRTERAFLDELGIERLAAVAGGSLGGMQAFEWAILFPDQVDAVVAIASTHALHPQGVAWNAIAREAIMGDPAWQGGHYYGTGDAPNAGMGIARMIGHITYLSAQALGDKFGRRLQFADDIRYTVTEPEFEVESYLRHQADSFVRRFDANTYLYTSRALDLLRPRAAVRRRLAHACARGRLGADAADRLQLRLAVSAVGLGGDRGSAPRARQTGRAPCDRRAVRPRLLPARRGAADADHPPLSRGACMTAERDASEPDRAFGFETRQLHAGQRPDPNTGARAVPIFQTTSYVFEDPESAAAYFNLQEYGNTYSRIMNPTVAVFEERIANLEGGAGGVAFASGIAAQAAALFTLLEPGDHVVSSSALYGGTVNQFKHLLRKMNVELTWVDPDDPDAWRKAVRPNTKAFFGETIGNPGGNVLDIESARVDRARARAAADRRQHVRDAVPVPPDRVGRRHRHPLGDQVHRRSRHEHRRRRRRGGHVQLVERTVPGGRGPIARLPRPAVPRDVRDLRLPDEAAGRDAARSRRGARAVQRLPVPAGTRDAVAADGASRRERAGRRGVPRVARARLERHLSRPARKPIQAAGRASTCRAAPARCSRSTARAGETAGRT